MRLAMTAAAAALLVLLSTSALTRAGDDGDDAPGRPAQDAVGLAALKRLAKLCPEPAAGGVEEVRASVLCVEGIPVRIPATLVWKSDGPAQLSIDGTSEAARQLEYRIQGFVGLPLLVREAWSPRRVATCEVTAEREDGALLVTMRERPDTSGGRLVLGDDGLPSEMHTLPPVGDPSPPGVTRLEFETRGERRLLSGFARDRGDRTIRVAIEHFDVVDEPVASDVPRRVTWTLLNGERAVFVLYDLLLDGRRVAGTTLAESLAGRARRVDDDAGRLLARHDAATASLAAAGVRKARCRVRMELPEGTVSFEARWTSEGVCTTVGDALSDSATEFERDHAFGARTGFGHAESRLLCPPSEQLWEYDAAAAGEDADARVVLTPLTAETSCSRIVLGFDGHGRIATLERHFRDGRDPQTETRTYEPVGDAWLHVASEVPDVVRTRTRHYVVEGRPPLRRRHVSEERQGEKTVVRTITYSDWVLDGEPVPGTRSDD